jgi:hypothetical protein
MTDATVAAAEAAKPKKTATAVRDWINPAGQPVDAGDEKSATGLRYIHLATAKRIKADYNPETDQPPVGSMFEHQFGNPGTIETMLAIFGGLTLAGNVVNTATNGPKGDPAADVIPMIAERFAELATGVWADRASGVGGVRYDKDLLSQTIATLKGETDPAPYLAKMAHKVDPKTGATVADDTKGAISYGAYALRNPQVSDAYAKASGKSQVTLGSL